MAHSMPVPVSPIVAPGRIGGPSGWPLMLRSPLNAWATGSKAGSIRMGPRVPKPEMWQ
jgi:hypothetical protein